MGRKKLPVQLIEDATARRATFDKRRIGVVKKAAELSILCGTEVAVIIFGDENKLFQYSSVPLENLFSRFHKFRGHYRHFSNAHIRDLEPTKTSSFQAGDYIKKKYDSLVPELRQGIDPRRYFERSNIASLVNNPGFVMTSSGQNAQGMDPSFMNEFMNLLQQLPPNMAGQLAPNMAGIIPSPPTSEEFQSMMHGRKRHSPMSEEPIISRSQSPLKKAKLNPKLEHEDKDSLNARMIIDNWNLHHSDSTTKAMNHMKTSEDILNDVHGVKFSTDDLSMDGFLQSSSAVNLIKEFANYNQLIVQ